MSKEFTIEETLKFLRNKAVMSSHRNKYNEVHLSINMDPDTSPFTSGLFDHGMPPVHEIYKGVPDFREQLSDRLKVSFNACKGMPVGNLSDGIVMELVDALDNLVTHVQDTEGDMWDWAREALRKVNVKTDD